MTYYNALVYTDYNTCIKYHSISNLKGFLNYIRKNVSFTKIYLYKLSFRDAKKGTYCAYLKAGYHDYFVFT